MPPRITDKVYQLACKEEEYLHKKAYADRNSSSTGEADMRAHHQINFEVVNQHCKRQQASGLRQRGIVEEKQSHEVRQRCSCGDAGLIFTRIPGNHIEGKIYLADLEDGYFEDQDATDSYKFCTQDKK